MGESKLPPKDNRGFMNVLNEMTEGKKGTKGYCQEISCESFRGYGMQCREGEYPTSEMKDCKKHPKKL